MMLIDNQTFSNWMAGVADACVRFDEQADLTYLNPEALGIAFAQMGIETLMGEYRMDDQKGHLLYAFACGLQRGALEAIAVTHPSMFEDPEAQERH